MSTSNLAVQRLRHPIKARLLRVDRINQITPRLVNVTFSGDDLTGFTSSSFDDHIKVFIPRNGVTVVPEAGPNGLVFPDDVERPLARDYTPRRYDSANNVLDIEFVLHNEGPATDWVRQARVGDQLVIAGPRGSFVIPAGFDWHIMIGDETALPAIARRLEELPSGVNVHVIVQVENIAEELSFNTRADAKVTWVYRDGGSGNTLEAAVHNVVLPDGQGYVWAAGESSAMRAIHRHFVTELGLDKSRIRASTYWKRGVIGAHEVLGDA
ncbi:MAG TPA: siderophore-interacting protein [Eoetvoesiella sp.]